ncbi:MAG: septal ring lytic transglycosylase RlpA family protein [Thiohalomonadales bacterium]
MSLVLSMSACTSLHQDGPPVSSHPDITKIVDPIPYWEPISKGGNPKSYVVRGKRYYPFRSRTDFSQTGVASWYGTKFHGKLTSNGERYDMYKMTAAHKTLPIPTFVKVTNLDNDRSVVVRVNDRGPFIDGRIIDLSYVAAIKLDMTKAGTAQVRIEAWYPGSPISNLHDVSESAEQGSDTNSLYYLQLGSFANKHNAEKMVSKLLGLTTESVMIDVSDTDVGVMYRVRLGPYQRQEAIMSIEKHFEDLGFKQQSLIHNNTHAVDVEAINQ